MTMLIDPGDSLIYISPKVVKKCHFQIVKFRNPWMVQVAMGAKIRVI